MSIPLCTVAGTPELIGVVAWWGVLLAAPIVFVRRRHRGRRAGLTAGERCEPGKAIRSGVECSRPHHRDEERPVSHPTTGAQTHRPVEPTGVVRLRPQTLEPLCRYVDFRRRLTLAVRELERRLSVLPADRWRIEPYPLSGERGNTLLVLGQSGVFVIAATYAPGAWDDVVTISRLAGKIQALLPDYPGQVQAAICHPFTAAAPRLWNRPDENGEWIGAWVIGGNAVIDWLDHFGAHHGLAPGDLERFDALSTPNWLTPAMPAAATWPPLPARAGSGLD